MFPDHHSLHRGLNKDEKAFDIVFSKMNDVRITHGCHLLDFAEISIPIHAELDSLANDVLIYLA